MSDLIEKGAVEVFSEGVEIFLSEIENYFSAALNENQTAKMAEAVRRLGVCVCEMNTRLGVRYSAVTLLPEELADPDHMDQGVKEACETQQAIPLLLQICSNVDLFDHSRSVQERIVEALRPYERG